MLSRESRPTAKRPFFVGGKALTLKRHFIEDVRAEDLTNRIRTLHRPLMVMHSPTDNHGDSQCERDIPNGPPSFRPGRRSSAKGPPGGSDHQRVADPHL